MITVAALFVDASAWSSSLAGGATRAARLFTRLIWRLRWVGAAVVIGLANAIPLLGLRRIDPTNLAWLAGDPATGYIGWAFYRFEPPWRFPLTWTSQLGYPAGVSISWLDSIPLMAVLLRPLSAVLPDSFQYLGIWACLCFVLQAYFALRLGSLLFPGQPLFVLGAALLIAGAPAVTWRMFGHHALASHWLIVAALWCYFRDASRVAASRWLLPFGAILALAGSVSPYLSVLCLVIAFAGIGRLILEGDCGWLRGGVFGVLLSGCMATSLVVFGFVVLGVDSSGYEGVGYGFFSMDLLAPINPMSYGSVVLPSLPVASYGQYEGYSYLGLGVIALWATNLVFRPRSVSGLLGRKTVPLLIAASLCTIAAASSTVTIGSVTVASFELPRFMQLPAHAFRASGRLFWIPHYLLIVASVVATYRGWTRPWRELLLVAALGVQITDLGELRRQVRASIDIAQAEVSPLRSSRWQDIRQDHERLIVLPAWECGSAQSPGGFQGFATFGLLAAEQRMATNSYHAGRMTREQRKTHCSDMPASVMSGDDLDPKAAYVVDDRFVIAWGAEGMTSHRCEVADGFNLCTTAPDGGSRGPARGTRLFDAAPPYVIGQPLDFRSSGNAEPFLWLGWSQPEPWGTWSVWREASLLFLHDLGEPSPLVVFATMRAFLNHRHRHLSVVVLANGEEVGRWEFDTGRSLERRVVVPAAVVRGRPVLHLRFVMSHPVSPASLGISADDRLLGIGMESLRVVRADERSAPASDHRVEAF